MSVPSSGSTSSGSMSAQERARRGFAPTVVLGVLSAVTATVAGTKPMVVLAQVESDRLREAGVVPLAGSIALLALVAWGAVLLSRGQVRRVAALVGLIGALGSLAAAGGGIDSAQAAVTDAALDLGADDVRWSLSAWFFAFVVSCILTALAFAMAVRHSPSWPAMSRRYDAPVGPERTEARTEQELWKALDEGRDPTRDRSPGEN